VFSNLSTKERASCELYYKLWRMGKSDADLRSDMGVSPVYFKRMLPTFLIYCRHHSKHETREKLVNGETPDFITLTPERREEFINYVIGGLSIDKAAMAMNIPLVTVMQVWFVEDPLLHEEIKMAKEKANAKVQLAIYKRANGYSYLSKQTSVVRQKITDKLREEGDNIAGKEDKGFIITTTEMKTEKEVAGDVNAQKFWSINQNSKNWSLDGEVGKDENKGTILKAIKGMLGVGEK